LAGRASAADPTFYVDAKNVIGRGVRLFDKDINSETLLNGLVSGASTRLTRKFKSYLNSIGIDQYGSGGKRRRWAVRTAKWIRL
jgi:hypothetical protein